MSLLIENSDCLWVDSPQGAKSVEGGWEISVTVFWSASRGGPYKRAEAMKLKDVTTPTTQDEFLSE